MTPEVLSGSNGWHCAKCKRTTDAEKVMHIFKAPEVLVVHIKRFSFSSYRRTKLTTAIRVPTRAFRLSPYIHDDGEPAPLGRVTVCEFMCVTVYAAPDKSDPSVLYNLVGVSNHSGGLGGGHYTA